MADKSYRVGDEVTVVYQAARDTPGIAVTMTVYNEAGVLDAAQSGPMTEIGTTGCYRLSFVPDAKGLWIVQADDTSGRKAVKLYSVDMATDIADCLPMIV